jgi:hypothetical protein
MSDDQAAAEKTETAEQPQEGAEQQSAEAKTFDADYVKKLRDEAAKYRTEAKSNAQAAQKLAEIEAANQTEAEKQATRLAEAEERAKALEVKAARAEVASEKGVPAQILAGPEDGTPEALAAFAELVIAYTEQAGKPRPPKPDPNQGRPGGAGPKSTADSFADYFRNHLPER